MTVNGINEKWVSPKGSSNNIIQNDVYMFIKDTRGSNFEQEFEVGPSFVSWVTNRLLRKIFSHDFA